MTPNLRSELRALLAGHDKSVQALALALRELVIDELAPCYEYAFQMRSKTVLLYGPTAHPIEDNICNIAVLRQHVTLTFRHGAELRDPRELLCGSGKIMRHLRIEEREDLERGGLRDLLREARRHAEADGVRFPRSNDRTVITRIKEQKPRAEESRRDYPRIKPPT